MIRFKYIFYALIISLITVGLKYQTHKKAKPTGKFEINQVFVIGDNEEAPPEYLFRSPQHIRTDVNGRIYVADRRESKVRVFDNEGRFLAALGREGKGPGEFRRISAIALDSKERLIVYDRMLQRFTRFPPIENIDTPPIPELGRLQTFPNPEEYMISPQFMYGLPDGRFLLYYHPLTNRSLSQPRLHVYGREFEKVSVFGRPDQWDLPQDDFINQLTRRFGVFSGHHVAPGTSDLLLAPWSYDGVLYRYNSAADGTWTLQQIEGQPPDHPIHEILYHRVVAPPSIHQQGNSQPDPPYKSLNSSLGNGKVMQSAARPRSMSKGVGQFSDGRVVHLSMKEDDEGILQLHLELFRPDGTLQRAGPIEHFKHDETEPRQVARAVSITLLWIDQRDRLYLVDRRSGFPVIRVVELEKD